MKLKTVIQATRGHPLGSQGLYVICYHSEDASCFTLKEHTGRRSRHFQFPMTIVSSFEILGIFGLASSN
jgi:hypothetical protein